MTGRIPLQDDVNDRSPGAIYLERCEQNLNMARFYAVSVERTLFAGEWILVRRWGRIGTSGMIHEEWFPSLGDALTAQARIASRKIRRGYGGR